MPGDDGPVGDPVHKESGWLSEDADGDYPLAFTQACAGASLTCGHPNSVMLGQ